MRLFRLVLSDLHLGTGSRPGELNPFEDFFHDDRFAELLAHYGREAGEDTGIELILNGDIFDLLKVKIGGIWPTEITAEIAAQKLRQCLDGHPVFVTALKRFMERPHNRITYLPGNHDLDMWFTAPQELFRRYIAPGDAGERVQFVTHSDTYYLPDGIQVRHGHQLERIHWVDYTNMTRARQDGSEVLLLPWGSVWILEVLNPLKAIRSHIDRTQPLGRFMLASLFLDPGFVFRFLYYSTKNFFKHRILKIQAWRDRLRTIPKLVKEEVISLTGGYDENAMRALKKMRGAHTLIVGHSHGPRYLQLGNGKTLVNTGTWVKMINLDLQYLGQDSGLTYAVIDYDDEGRPRTRLLRWYGVSQPCEVVPYAD